MPHEPVESNGLCVTEHQHHGVEQQHEQEHVSDEQRSVDNDGKAPDGLPRLERKEANEDVEQLEHERGGKEGVSWRAYP